MTYNLNCELKKNIGSVLKPGEMPTFYRCNPSIHETYVTLATFQCTYTCISLQFPAEINFKGSEIPTKCVPFRTNYDYGADY